MNIADDLNHAYHNGYETAKRDAIKAISSVDDYANSWVTYTVAEATNAIKKLPSAPVEKVQSEQWIPCADHQPTNEDWTFVTILDESGDTPYRYTDVGWYLEAAKCWIVGAEQRTDVVAWMPYPKPWKGKNDA